MGMRLPVDKLYRAFPELDRFTDEECRGWLKQTWRARSGMIMVGWVMALATAPVVFATGMISATLLISSIASAKRTMSGPPGMVLGIMGAAVIGALGLVAGLVVRDVVLRRCVRSQLKSTRCSVCGYQLLGLPVTGGVVTCSECGHRLELAAVGLTVDDLRIGSDVARESESGSGIVVPSDARG